MANYLIYPFKTMRITQNQYGVTADSKNANHKLHSSGTPKDYPLDEAGADGGRSWFYCPCDEMKITKLYGNQSVGHHIWLESTSKVLLANGKSDYVTILVVHANTDDYSQLKVGQKFKRKEKIVREGVSGQATGNHTHYAIGLGRSSSSKIYWQKNNKGVWVLVTPNGPIKPEAAMYVDKNFTTVSNARELKFITLGEDDMSKGYFEKGDSNEGVYVLNSLYIQLNTLGYIKSKPEFSNVYTEATVSAAKEVQKQSGLAQDGKTGPKTIKAVHSLINQGFSSQTQQLKDTKELLKKAKDKITNAQNALK